MFSYRRLALAQQLLETTAASMDAIAEKASFGLSATFRQQFNRTFNISPSNYRTQFRES